MIDREKLASLQHNIWSHWMIYLFSQCVKLKEGYMIPMDKAMQWQRQMKTLYKDLSNKERESDRHQADKVLRFLGNEEGDD
jgi:hypothetical protein